MAMKSTTGKRETDSGDHPSTADVLASFFGCPRCSYFLSGYRLIHDDLETTIRTSSKTWLSLVGDFKTRKLIHESFGSQTNLEADYFDGICPVCRRRYILDRSDDKSPTVRIKISSS
jgi:hypothetical protein